MAVKGKHYIGIRSKIVTYTILCIISIGLLSNLVLYRYMHNIIEGKVQNIHNLYAETIAAQINYALERVSTLDFYCLNSEDVVDVLRYQTLNSLAARNKALIAQDTMNSYLRTSPIDNYINKLIIFNDEDVFVHAVSTYFGTRLDELNLRESEQFARWQQGMLRPFDNVYRSISPGGHDCFVFLSEVYAPSSYKIPVGYVYIEVDTRLVTDVLAPYNQVNRFLVQTDAGVRLLPGENVAFLEAIADAKTEGSFSYEGNPYSVKKYDLARDSLTLLSCINQAELLAGGSTMSFSVLMVIIMIIGIGAAVLVILTRYITKPIARITEKINKIALNDYSFDPELETPHNEMGDVGARLNELGMGFQTLLDETIALHDERAEIEMALLQSQVNPHFLYNTLNSVHWMAVMQKNTGIEKTVRCLVNLLKNISKGVSAKITLEAELSLLQDYINIQSIRYMGAFDYICNIPAPLRDYTIPKFTLQPLVENAIFHGIVPKGTLGTITLDAYEDGAYLVITITDDGVGMTPEGAAALLRHEGRVDRSSMSGIGVTNVNQRLKLTYGREAGLSVESVPDAYTRLSVHILKEVSPPCGGAACQ